MRNIGLLLSYDGSKYFGYQRQNGFITIQECLENAIYNITKEKSVVYGCGRTDTGVHAMKYLASFKTNARMPVDKFPVALNTQLPEDIAITDAFEADEDFNGRFSVKKKTYKYLLYNSKTKNPFLKNYAWHCPYSLDFDKMCEGAEYIKGKHDFLCFMASGGQVKRTVRTIYELTLEKNGDTIEMNITADGFLYNMVRIIMGTLVYVGCGKLEPFDIIEIIDSRNRTRAGITAPPNGLYLKEIYY